MKTIHVAAAVIHSGSSIFATQRGYGPWRDGWEFPGGKVEPGETPEEALRREIREELDADILVENRLAHVEYTYPEFHLSMDCYSCSLLSDHVILKEHESARWLTAQALNSVDWLPADRLVLEDVRRLLEASLLP